MGKVKYLFFTTMYRHVSCASDNVDEQDDDDVPYQI